MIKGLETLRRYESEKGIKLSASDEHLVIEYIFPLELPFRSSWRAKEPVVNLLRINKTARDIALYIIEREKDFPLKRGVIIAIGQAGCEEGLEILVNCFDNEETDYEAIMALGYMGGSRARDALVNFVYRFKDRYHVREAIKSLGRINDEETIQFLLKFLEQNKQAKFRKEIMQTLGEMKARSAETNLISLLNDRNEYVVGEAATALAKIGSKSSVDNLLKCLERERCPPQVAYALGELGDDSILDNLANALMRNYEIIEFETNMWYRDSDESRYKNSFELSRELITVMKKIDEEESYNLLLQYLEHKEYSGYAAWALREFGSKSIKPLIGCLSGLIRPKTVRYAIESLKQLNAREALSDLERFLYSPLIYDDCNDSKGRISDLARESIEEILIGKSIRRILQEEDYDYFDKLKTGRTR